MRAYSLKGRGERREEGRKENNRDKADRQTRSEYCYVCTVIDSLAQVYTTNSLVQDALAYTFSILTVLSDLNGTIMNRHVVTCSVREPPQYLIVLEEKQQEKSTC